MAKQKYSLNKAEKILFKVDCVRHGFWGAYTHILVVTNQCVILEQYGMLNNFKGIIRYPYPDINQAIIGKASNGERQLELYLDGSKEDFALQSGDEKALKTLVMAINDQLASNVEDYDYSYDYYQNILEGSKAAEKEIERAANSSIEGTNINVKSGLNFVGDVAKNVLKSGDLSIKGVGKGIAKTTGKSVMGGFVDNLLDDIGVHDIQDSFTEIGNEFRDLVGLKHKMTHSERRALEEKAEKRKKQEIERKKKEAYNNQVEQARQSIVKKKAEEEVVQEQKNVNSSFEDNIELLKKLKELLDVGIITQEEFDAKKKQLLDL